VFFLRPGDYSEEDFATIITSMIAEMKRRRR
jgi:hypothetical protein